MKPSSNSIAVKYSDDIKALTSAFNKHLWTYKTKADQCENQAFFDCAFDLFHMVQTQRKSIVDLEIKAGIRKPKKEKVIQ
ncbi:MULTISPECIES: hypothetical protein [unclassified Campylobacter]|uniref:hypothetical protein n=1 Tax=unclassified Campylobacter TaxID=2593542 RepID=UPI003D3508EF